jgi:hypothetical protein
MIIVQSFEYILAGDACLLTREFEQKYRKQVVENQFLVIVDRDIPIHSINNKG